MNDEQEHEKRKKVTITIDGQSFVTRDDDQEAASLLRLAGVDPAQYDLAKINRHGEPKVYRDEKVIDLKDGDAFVTVRHSAPVA
ncbi:multiubiquitin [Kribbella amoyensis]|uniref:Multiubiquitin n=1 Tax=Kribbella amoyensis TaxID=996641 RepID=A0A561B8I7_9ACTN|nr:multiubiquitin domain-containing protein [Kribbella amoyensis]TWD75077.1 multiubiquitin [Kribbella amoyensis]